MSGQICRGMPLGNAIYGLSRHPMYRTFLDIGTFTGLGTTKILADSLQCNTMCKIYSVEANAKMYNIACMNWTPRPVCLELLWGTLSQKMMTEHEIRSHPSFNDIKPHFDIHYKQDVIDFQKAPLVSLPDTIDVVIADGGEFCGLSDMERYLKHDPKVIVLDDVNVMKNCDVKTHLLANGWYITAEGNDRNGWAVLERKEHIDDRLYAESFDRYCTALGY